jgi:Fe-S-cluster-containing dehydrogenase component
MVSRRDFLKITGTAAGTVAAAATGIESARASGHDLDPDRIGVLADFTLCIGCRRCEWACAEQNGFPHGTLEEYDDQSVFAEKRRPDAEHFTVVNRYDPLPGSEKPLDVKVQCLHCEHPACVSACIVGALEKSDLGPVTYEAWKCIGCRYCMIACPYQVPAYEYDNALTPKVMKCTMCTERTLEQGKPPACVEMCPREALVFGRRQDLLELARDRIRMQPKVYLPHVFGEYDGGGSSWLMLSDRRFRDVDLPELPDTSPAEITEGIQHGIFRGFSGPLMLFGLVSILYKSMGNTEDRSKEDEDV